MKNVLTAKVSKWIDLEADVEGHIATVKDDMEEKLERIFTENSNIEGVVAASVGRVRQDEKFDDDRVVHRQPIYT